MNNFINDYWFALVWFGALAVMFAYTFLEHRYNRKPDKRKTLNRDYKGKK